MTAQGTLVLRRGSRRTTVRLTATAGRGTVTFRLPRRAGRYVLELDLRAADQTATDRASVIVR